MRKLTLPSFMPSLKTIASTLYLGCISYAGYADVAINKASNGGNICPNTAVNGITPAYTNVGNIVFTEGAATDFGDAAIDEISISAPAGWQFNTAALPTVTFTTGMDITSVSRSFVGGVLVIDVSVGTNTKFDQLTISGLQAEPMTTGAANGRLTVAMTSGAIAGLPPTPNNLGALKLAPAPTPTPTALPTSLCVGNTLTLTANPSGGSGTFVNYAWNGPSFSSGLQNTTIPAVTLFNTGSYSVTVTDDNGCMGMGVTSHVDVNSNPTISASALPTSICEGNTLSLTSVASGGSLVYNTYAWNGPGFSVTSGSSSASEPNILVANQGVYSVTVTDNNGCMGSGITAPVAVHTNPTLTASVTPNPICAGNTVTLTATPVGGGGSNSFAWSGPGFSTTTSSTSTTIPNITTSGQGMYNVTVTDANTCTASASTLSLVVNTPPTLTASAAPNPICVGKTLTLTAVPVGGGGSNSFTWSGPGFSTTTPSTTATIASVATGNSGVYSVTVTDANTCTASAVTASVTVNTNPTISASTTPTSICVGNTLALNSTPAGGSLSYTSFTWNGPDGIYTSPGQNASVFNIATSQAGVYSVTVTDSHGCMATGITGPVTVNTNPTVSVFSAPAIICAGNTISLSSTPAGGPTPFTFAWTGPNSFTGFAQAVSVPSVTASANGIYSLTVTDNNGCKGFGATSSLTVNDNPTIAATATPTALCVGSPLTLTSVPSGGDAPYASYTWNGPSFTVTSGSSGASIPSVVIGNSGIYSVTVTDNNGCMGTGTTASVTVNANPTLTASALPNPICVGSTLNLSSTPGGGSGTYPTFVWHGPASYLSGGQTTTNPLITTGGAGIYSVTVTDGNGCMASATTLSVTVNTNPVVTATVTPNPICVGNTLTVTSIPTGGSGVYGYSWSGPNSFTATTQVGTVASITTAAAGVYSVVVTDNKGCVGTAMTPSVTVNINPTITATVTPNPICVGNTLTLNSTPASGSGTYNTFVWNGPGPFTTAGQSATRPNIATNGAGIYTVTVTDNNGCFGSVTTTSVTVNVNPTITATVTPNPICVGNTVSLNSTPAGGSGTYSTFAWTGPNTYNAGTQSASISSVATVNAGVYSVTVTDNNGCMGSATTASLTVNVNPTITATVTPNPICVGGTVSLNSTPAGGSGTYSTFAWAGPNTYNAGTQSASILSVATVNAGVYSVTVTDNNGCIGSATTASLTVNVNPTITATVTPNPICVGGTVSLNSTPAGGSGTYSTFAWAGPNTYNAGTQSASILSVATVNAGVYSVTVTDNNGCIGSATTASLTVNVNPTITATVTPNPICTGATLGLTSLPASGSGTYNSFTWSGPGGFTAFTQNASNANITPAGAGVYTVTVTDNLGCTGMGTTSSVTVNPLPTVYMVTGGGDYCSGTTAPLIGLSGSDAGVGYQLYREGAGNVGLPVFNALGGPISFSNQPIAGTYTVQATTTITGCTSNMADSAVIGVLPLPTPISVTITNNGHYCATGAGVHLGLFTSVSGINYQLFNIDGVASASMPGNGLPIDFGAQTTAGSYTVIATNGSTGCTSMMTGNPVVVIDLLPIAQTITGGGSYCMNGAGVPIWLEGSEVGVVYQLNYGTPPSPAGLVAGDGDSVTFGNFITGGGPYVAIATNTTTGCTNNMLSSVTVTVLPLPTQLTVTGGGTYCRNGAGVAVGLDSSVTGFSYQLYDGATTVGGPIEGTTGSAIDFGLQTAVGTYTVLATDDLSSCMNGMLGNAIVDTFPLPPAHDVAGGGTLCSNAVGYHVGMNGSDMGINYQLYNGSIAVGAPVAGNGGGIDFGIFTTAGTYTVMATNTVTGCTAGMPGSAVFIVNPAPQVFNVSGGGGYCINSGGVSIGLTGSQTGVDYQLYLGGVAVGLPVHGTDNPLDFGLQITAGTYSVSATTLSTSCMSNMSGGTVVTINQLPVVYSVTGGGNYCQNGTGEDISLTGSEVGVNYQLYNGSATFGAAIPGQGGSGALDFGMFTTAGTYTVMATDPSTHCSSDMLLSATIGVYPLPVAFNVTGGGTLCFGNTGFNIGLDSSTSTISYQLYDGATTVGAVVPGSGTSIDFGVYAAAGTYTVLATNGSTGCINAMIGNAVIVVNPLPDAITGATMVCTGATVTYTDDSTGGTWTSDGSGFATVDPTTGVVSGVNAGTTAITYTLPTGCSATTSILVNQAPDPITGNNNVCAGSVTTLNSTTSGGTWSNVATSVATVDMNTGDVTGVSAGTDYITYTVTNGCFAIFGETVNALPVIPAIDTPSSSVCESGIITYANSLTGGTWSSSATSTAVIDATTGDITGINAGTATITYTFTNGSGCTAFVTQDITVNPRPTVASIAGVNNVCQGATIAMSDATSGGTWNSSSSNASISASGIVTGVNVGTATISYTVSNNFGCSTTSVFGITIGTAMPASSITPAHSATLCGGPVSLSVSSTDAASITSYQWVVAGGAIGGADSANYLATLPGFYEVVIGNGSCYMTLTGTNVIAPPDAVIAFDSATNILNTGSFATYAWSLNGNPISGGDVSTISADGPGIYDVIVTDGNGCADTATYTIQGGTTGIANQNIAKAIRIYPNPVTSILYIDAPVKVMVSVLSPDGKVLIDRKEALNINVGQLADGMYMILIYDEHNTLLKTDRFVKMQ